MKISDYNKDKRILMNLCFSTAAATCSEPPMYRGNTGGAPMFVLVEFVGMALMELCRSKDFWKEFEHLLEVSENTPKNIQDKQGAGMDK